MKKKIIKLINNERLSIRISSQKGCAIANSDICHVVNADKKACTTYAYDECGKDYSACSQGADDICTVYDSGISCSGPGSEDECRTDYAAD